MSRQTPAQELTGMFLNAIDMDRAVDALMAAEAGERIEAPAQDDWRCICGNFVGGAGFYPCLPDGTYVEPNIGGPWDEKLVKCDTCERIMDQSTWDGATVAVVRGATDGS